MAKSRPTAGKRRLGRGLGSLLSAPVHVDLPGDAAEIITAPPPPATGAPRPDAAPAEPAGEGLRMVDPAEIRPNPAQPRQSFDEAALEALADSIRTAGLMQPLIVRPDPAGGFSIVAGERRWRAARLVGLGTVPVVVHELDDRQTAEWALIENLQREDLNPLERADAFDRLVREHKLTHQEVAESVGLDRSTVSNHLRLLELDDLAREAVRTGLLTPGHAKALLAIASLDQRQGLTRKAIRQGWSVRELERRVRSVGEGGSRSSGTSPASRSAPAHMKDLERRLGEHLGTRVQIQPGRKRNAGKLMIEYYDLDQFDGLMDRLGFKCD